MACRNAYKNARINKTIAKPRQHISMPEVKENVNRLLFGVDSRFLSSILLQNNLDMYEWVLRNKTYPNFWGRNINGENALSKEEVKYIHGYACKVAPYYISKNEKETEEQGKLVAQDVISIARKLEISLGTAIFLEIGASERATTKFMRGFADTMIESGYTPGFKANTDAKYGFDREFSRGIQINKEIFEKCLIWAVAPSLVEYDRMKTTHLIHPDNWGPFAPSGISRKEIAIWQYGKECHPIEDDFGNLTHFNLNLVRNEDVIIDKMF